MSLLVRAAVLGGLAYVVTRAVRNKRESDFLTDSRDFRTGRLSDTSDPVRDDTWETKDRYSTGALSIGNP